MNFFEQQDKARKNTKVLVVYFVIAVACIIASVYLASLLIFYGASVKQQAGTLPPELVLWDPQLFLHVVLGTLGLVIIGSPLSGNLKSGRYLTDHSTAARSEYGEIPTTCIISPLKFQRFSFQNFRIYLSNPPFVSIMFSNIKPHDLSIIFHTECPIIPIHASRPIRSHPFEM